MEDYQTGGRQTIHQIKRRWTEWRWPCSAPLLPSPLLTGFVMWWMGQSSAWPDRNNLLFHSGDLPPEIHHRQSGGLPGLTWGITTAKLASPRFFFFFYRVSCLSSTGFRKQRPQHPDPKHDLRVWSCTVPTLYLSSNRTNQRAVTQQPTSTDLIKRLGLQASCTGGTCKSGLGVVSHMCFCASLCVCMCVCVYPLGVFFPSPIYHANEAKLLHTSLSPRCPLSCYIFAAPSLLQLSLSSSPSSQISELTENLQS